LRENGGQEKKKPWAKPVPPEHLPEQRQEHVPTAEVPEPIFQLALSVFTQVRLVDVALTKLSIDRADDVGIEPLVHETTHVGQFGNNPEQTTVYIQPTLSLRAYKPNTDKRPGEPVVRIDATFLLIYACENVAQIPTENISAFAMTSGAFTIWPYWRELVMDASMRMRIAPIVVPPLQPIQPKPEPHRK
jgi:hypothetical protein